MIPEQVLFQEKISQLLSGERSQHRQRILASSCCYALVASVATLPATLLLPGWARPWMAPIFFLLAAPMLFVRHRWGSRESTRVITRLDRTLQLKERSLTAWEILTRSQIKPTELWVVKEAGEQLQFINPKSFVKRRLTWQTYLILPLLALWVGLLSFDFGAGTSRAIAPPIPKSLAQQLDEFSRQLQERAKADELRESLQLGRQLEKLAKDRLVEVTPEDYFRKDLLAMLKKIESAAQPAPNEPNPVSDETVGGLRDLKTELEAARDTRRSQDISKTERGISPKLLERLGALPHLRRKIERGMPSVDALSEKDLESFLDRLGKEVTTEFDRRTLLEAQRFIAQLLGQGQGQRGESDVHIARKGTEGFLSEEGRGKNIGSLPGNQPGRKTDAFQPFPLFGQGAETHLKGLLREGKSAGLNLKGEPSRGESEVSEEEVLALYRRQAEEALHSERIPEALKETIRNYFLSLGMDNRQR